MIYVFAGYNAVSKTTDGKQDQGEGYYNMLELIWALVVHVVVSNPTGLLSPKLTSCTVSQNKFISIHIQLTFLSVSYIVPISSNCISLLDQLLLERSIYTIVSHV